MPEYREVKAMLVKKQGDWLLCRLRSIYRQGRNEKEKRWENGRFNKK